jgi:uncharacterized damage-inducible protein DinB
MDNTQAQLLTQFMTQLWEGEFPATCKVLEAVPDDRCDYRPDDKSRTARELAAHLAMSDIWFLRSILEGAFVFDQAASKNAESQFKSTKEIVDYYKREFPAHLAKVRAMPVEKLTDVVDFFGFMQQPNVTYLGFANNHSIHHRGQLARTFGRWDPRCPRSHGASADENLMAAPRPSRARRKELASVPADWSATARRASRQRGWRAARTASICPMMTVVSLSG